MKKIILISLAVIVVLIVVGIVVVAYRIDGIVRQTVEREGTNQLDLTTTLANADVGLFSGSLTLDELAVANPEGYSAPRLLELGQIHVGVSYGQLTGDPVRIKSVTINSPRLTIERGGQGLADLAKLNIRDLMDRLDTGEPTPEGEATKMIIDQLTVSRAQVVIRPNVPGLDEEYAITIPDVTLNNIGTGDEAQNGAEIGRVTADVVMALARRAAASEDLPEEVQSLLEGDIRSIANQYAAKLGAEVRQELEQHLGELGTGVGGAAEKLLQGDTKGAVDDAQKKAGETIQQEAQNRLGGLLGGRRTPPATQPTTQPSGQ